MSNRNLFIQTVWVDRNKTVHSQTKNLLRGQWVRVNGMQARVLNILNNRAVLWMQKDKMVAVFQ